MGDTRLRINGSNGHGGYAFGPFVVDSLKRQLWRERRLVPITSKTFDVLVVLLEHRDHIVSKDELLNRVWPDTAVNENNLARQVSSLRRALGQRPDQHDFVVTIPGHGYRFVATVQDLSDVRAELPTIPRKPGADRDIHWHEAPEPALDLDDHHVADELLSGQPIPGVSQDDGHPVSSTGPNARWTVLGTLVATSCGLLATAVAVTLLRPANPSPQPRRTLQRITYDEAALPRDAAWAPDGQWVVFTNDRAGNADLWKQRLGDPDPVRLTTSEANESQPRWSPDGQSIVFRSERDGGGLYVIPANGGVERMVSTFGYEPLWSPDGTLILFKRSAVLPDLPTIYVVGLDGKPPRPVRPDVLGQFRSLHAAWHPDGRRDFHLGNDRQRRGEIPDGATRCRQRHHTRDIGARPGRTSRAFRPGGSSGRRRVGTSISRGEADDTQNIWRVTVDPVTEAWVDGPERLTTGAGEETNLALSPDGTRLVFTATSSRTRLWAFPFDAASGRVTGQPYPDYSGQHGRSGFRRARRRLEGRVSHRPRWPQRVVGTIDCRRTGAAAAVEHGLAIREAAVVSGWREARVLALCDAGQLASQSRCSIQTAAVTGC